MRTVLAFVLAASITGATAQTPPQAPAPPDPSCPPETRQNTPGANPNTSLSDKLADSRGIICPPGVDPAMAQKPPAEGTIKIVPPPGSPGGDPRVLPK
jgi:hypothetical protein